MESRIVLDWDGTVTERDTLDLVLREFGDLRSTSASSLRSAGR